MAEGPWFDALPPAMVRSFDVVVSNPPYVARDDDQQLALAVRGPLDRAVAAAVAYVEELVTDSSDARSCSSSNVSFHPALLHTLGNI